VFRFKNSIPTEFFACSAFAFFLSIESYLLSLLNWSILQDLHSRNLQNGKLSDEDDDVPSAPPICGSVHEIKQGAERSPASKVCSTPHAAGSCEVSSKKDRNTLETTSNVKPEHVIGNRNPDEFVRFVSFSDGCFLAKAISKHVFGMHIKLGISQTHIHLMHIILCLCALKMNFLVFIINFGKYKWVCCIIR
jgi:hypothetical protein